MKNMFCVCMLALAALMVCGAGFAVQDSPYAGRWALTIPGGRAGWLGVDQDGEAVKASVLWGGGSVVPAKSAVIDDKGELVVMREIKRTVNDPKPGEPKTQISYEYVHAKVAGNEMTLIQIVPKIDGKEERNEFTGKRIAPLPSRPDLAKVKFGKPIQLLKNDSLKGWKLVNEEDANGWSVKDGLLNNSTVQNDSKKGGRLGNLRTEREFEDFNLKADVCVDKGQNSGIYLRGIYEVQLGDSYGHDVGSHNMGAIYSRITPTTSAEKKPGEWQTLDITLVDRHVTVILNDVTIIDNEPLLGCTGGALWSDETRPGPLYLQGDHGPIQFRNIVLRPVVK
jgi:hypothetical protein